MINRLIELLFGKFEKGELKKFLFLAAIFAFTIGIYWSMRTTKDAVLTTMLGSAAIPWAKWLSMGVVLPLVLVYGLLVDAFPRHRVFYVLSAFYGGSALLFSYFLNHPTIGISASADVTTWWQFLPWAYYVFVESFGSIMVALFWSFAADTTTPESAKRGYSLVAIGAQVGAILGSGVSRFFGLSWGTGNIVGGAGLAMLCVIPLIFVFVTVVPQDQLQSYESKAEEEPKKKKPKVSFGEGLRLLVSQPYLLGIFAVIAVFEVVATLFDFKFKALAAATLSGSDEMTAYLGGFGLWTSAIALISLLLGIGNIGRKLGLTVSLTILPIIVGVLAVIMGFNSTLSVAFYVMVAAKALNYALNQPAKEQLYIPTSKDAKYKSKAFMEMFGSRSSKAAGSGVNMIKTFVPATMFGWISLFSSLALCGVWFVVALQLGARHKEAVDKNEVVC
jgi:AAA family ATP:ADP antiporter